MHWTPLADDSLIVLDVWGKEESCGAKAILKVFIFLTSLPSAVPGTPIVMSSCLLYLLSRI